MFSRPCWVKMKGFIGEQEKGRGGNRVRDYNYPYVQRRKLKKLSKNSSGSVSTVGPRDKKRGPKWAKEMYRIILFVSIRESRDATNTGAIELVSPESAANIRWATSGVLVMKEKWKV